MDDLDSVQETTLSETKTDDSSTKQENTHNELEEKPKINPKNPTKKKKKKKMKKSIEENPNTVKPPQNKIEQPEIKREQKANEINGEEIKSPILIYNYYLIFFYLI